MMNPVMKGCQVKLAECFFPVKLKELSFEEGPTRNPKEISYVHFDNFRAVVAMDTADVFACVTPNYHLILNDEAYVLGLDVARIIFGVGDTLLYNDWAYLSGSRGSCQMQIACQKHICPKIIDHKWNAFILVANSYNRSCKLSYRVGFSMETMDDVIIPPGLLIPKLDIVMNETHDWDGAENSVRDQAEKLASRLNVFDEFEAMVNRLCEIEISREEILPIFCKMMGIKTKQEPDNSWKELACLLVTMDKESQEWIDKCGMNAYAALCSFASFQARHRFGIGLPTNDKYQTRLGKWAEEIIHLASNQDFSTFVYIGREAYETAKAVRIAGGK